jgi:hypothetical protein
LHFLDMLTLTVLAVQWASLVSGRATSPDTEMAVYRPSHRVWGHTATPPTPDPPDRDPRTRTRIHDIPLIRIPNPQKTPYPPLCSPKTQRALRKIWEMSGKVQGIIQPPTKFTDKFSNDWVYPPSLQQNAARTSERGGYFLFDCRNSTCAVRGYAEFHHFPWLFPIK